MRKWVMVKEKIVKEDGRYLIYYRFRETRSLSEKEGEPTDNDQPSRFAHLTSLLPLAGKGSLRPMGEQACHQSYYADRRR